jgi:hypothetical protein
MIGIVAGLAEGDDDESGGISAQAQTFALWMIDPIFWVWALVILAGVGWSVYRHGLPRLARDEVEAVVDAMLIGSSAENQ